MSEEIKVKTASDEKPAEVAKWPGFDMPSFGSNWFELNPFALMKKFGVGLDHAFHMAMAENGMWAPTVEVKEAGGKFRVSAELPGVKPNDIKSPRRHKSVAGPRAIAMYLARHLTKDSYPDLGRAFGGKHHTTVISAVEKIELRIKEDPGLRGELHAIESTITR